MLHVNQWEALSGVKLFLDSKQTPGVPFSAADEVGYEFFTLSGTFLAVLSLKSSHK